MFKKSAYLLILLLIVPSIYGIGIGSFTREITFEPNLETSVTVYVMNNVGKDIRVKLDAQGGLSQYVSFEEEFVNIEEGGRKEAVFYLKLPESIPPGENRLDIGATDVTGGIGGISALTAAYKAFIIYAPHTGKYLEGGMFAEPVNDAGIVKIHLDFNHLGDENIDTLGGELIIKKQGTIIDTISLGPERDIAGGTNRRITLDWDSNPHGVGDYNLEANLDYDGQDISLTASFRVGAILLRILNHTTEIYQKEINRFDVEIASSWSVAMDEVYADVVIGDEIVQSEKVELSPWGSRTLASYVDAANLDEGEQPVDITVHYEGKEAKSSGVVTVLPEREKVVELLVPTGMGTLTWVLIGAVALLVLVNIILLLRKRQQ